MKYTLTKKDEYLMILLVSSEIFKQNHRFDNLKEEAYQTQNNLLNIATRFFNIEFDAYEFVRLMTDEEQDQIDGCEIGHTYAELVQLGAVDLFREIARRNSMPYTFPELDKNNPMEGWNNF